MESREVDQSNQTKVQRRVVLGLAASAVGAAVFASRMGNSGSPIQADSVPSTPGTGAATATPQATAAATAKAEIASTPATAVPDPDIGLRAMATPELEEPSPQGPSHDAPIVVKWRNAEINIRYHPPTLAKGKLYLSPGAWSIAIVNAYTGELVWTDNIASNEEVSPVVVEGDILYFSSNDRIGSSIQAVSAATFQEIWMFTPQRAGASPVTVVNGTLYVGADGGTYAFDALTGETHWFTENTSSSATRPDFAQDRIYISSPDGNIHCLDATTGARIWQQNVGGNIDASLTVGAPVVAQGRVHAWGGNAIYALDAANGNRLWQRSIGNHLSDVSVVAGVVYVDHDSTFHALDATTGDTLWQFYTGQERTLRPHAVTDEVLYLFGANLYALNASTGVEVARHPLPETSMVHSTQITVDDGYIFSNYEGDSLVALGNHTPTILQTDVVVRGAPSATAIERGVASMGDEIAHVGPQDSRTGVSWVEVTIGEVTGWIPLDAIDPTSLPPDGGIEYVFTAR